MQAMNTAPTLFDAVRLTARRDRARRMAREDAGFLLDRAAADMADRLAVANRDFVRAVDILTPGPGLAPALAASVPGLAPEHVQAADMADLEKALPVEAGYDLAVSGFGLHWLDDLPGALALIRRALKPDGLFMAALPAEGTLSELRDTLIAAEVELSGGAGARVDPFIEVRQAGSLLQRAGFALPVADIERIVVRYGSVAALIADLRAMGATSVLTENRKPLPRGVLPRLEAIYAERHSDPDGRLTASFNLLHLTGWAPHESQQKPLKPGSAEVSLTRILKR